VKAKRLGRGLSSLINRTEGAVADREAATTAAPERATPGPEAAAGVRRLPLAAVRPNPFQPRARFDEAALEELTASIREHGILQPIVVRRTPVGFEVIAGERRLRAAQALGLESLPAVVRDATDEEMQTLALVENLQREDLNAMEKARALRAMMRNFELTQEGVAERVGKARTTIANLLRLLDLPAEIQAMVEEGVLTGAHARAVLQVRSTSGRIELARKAAARGWSVREVERRARGGPKAGTRRVETRDPYLKDLEDRLRRRLGAEVRMRARGKGGRIEIAYTDNDDLDRLLEALDAHGPA
jgi:ParB family chromosome partitioning protein